VLIAAHFCSQADLKEITMLDLTTEERFVLVALQMTNHATAVGPLQRLTSLPELVLKESALKLEKLGLVQSAIVRHHVVYSSVEACPSPVRSNCQDWISAFRLRPSQLPSPNDHLGAVFASCRAVMLSAAMTGNRGEDFLANLTQLPLEFVDLLVQTMEQSYLWWSDEVWELRRALEKDLSDFTDIIECLDSLSERLWCNFWEEETLNSLQQFHPTQFTSYDPSMGERDPDRHS
jgi:hypothetical protein